tara:strand:- start:470 stop:721 length:252 start_codon:yes stop_codon:yes gene_type:complete
MEDLLDEIINTLERFEFIVEAEYYYKAMNDTTLYLSIDDDYHWYVDNPEGEILDVIESFDVTIRHIDWNTSSGSPVIEVDLIL